MLEDFEMYQFLINHGKKSDISFVGYDANNSTKYGFAMYVLDELGMYPDIKKLFLNKINSHGMDAFTDKKRSMISIGNCKDRESFIATKILPRRFWKSSVDLFVIYTCKLMKC